MALTNKGFEDAGAGPGDALNWTGIVVSSIELVGDFGGGGAPTPVETFETGWGNTGYLFAFGPGDTTLGSFNSGDDTSPDEGFEIGWGNQGYLFFLGATLGGTFTGSADVEGFETGWGNSAYLDALGPGDATDATFVGTGTVETFEAGWGNSAYLDALGPGDATDASFDGPVPQDVEDFEEVSPRRTFVADSTNSKFLAANHQMPNEHPVYLKGPGLSTGFAEGILYYVHSANTNDFKLSLTPQGLGGVAIPVTDSGHGTVFGDPARYWNEVE